MPVHRRAVLQSAGLSASLAALGLAKSGFAQGAASKAQVVVIGGGFGGATAAKYVRLLSNYKISVMLIEPAESFVSCPMSNLVVGGLKGMDYITLPYSSLAKNHGVTVVRDSAKSIDASKRTVTLTNGSFINYDKLVVAPGIDMMLDSIEGFKAANRAGQIVHAWKAGAETLTLRKQIEAMQDGGTFAITIPTLPYRCPPAPYERASLVAAYFKAVKPKSKVLVLDSNPDVTSKSELFKKAWAEQYAGMLEYRPDHKVTGVNGQSGAVQFEVQDDAHADVVNALPDMRAGLIAVNAGLANMANGRWCGVNFQTFESTVAKDVFVIGDSIQIAPLMPKSGHMANSQAKVTAAAIVQQLADKDVNPLPTLANTCYSFVNGRDAVHVSSRHEYVASEKTFKLVASANELSSAASAQEGVAAAGWASGVWADILM